MMKWARSNNRIKISAEMTTENRSRKLPQYLAAATATIGGFAMGTVVGWSSPSIELIKKEINLTASDVSWIGSAANLGGAVVMIPMAFLTDHIGRKLAMIILAPPMIAGWLLLAFSNTVPMYIAGRFITGVFGAAYSVVGPIYNGEISEKDIRGTLGAFYQLFLCAGALFVYLLGYINDVFLITIICVAIPVLLLVCVIFIPESPVYLLKTRQNEKAKQSLQWLRGKQCNIESEFKDIENFVQENLKKKQSIKDIMKSRQFVRGLIICVGLMVCQQGSGIKALASYAATIFKDAGTDLDPNSCTAIIGTALTLGTALSAYLADKLGRRMLLVGSQICMTISLTVTGAYFYIKVTDYNLSTTINWLPIVSLTLYIITYTMGPGACSWVILGEIFPTETKGIAGSISACVNWLLAFVVTISFPYMVQDIGSAGSFWIFAGISFLGLLFVWFFVVETKGKSLQEIQVELSGEKETKHVDSNDII